MRRRNRWARRRSPLRASVAKAAPSPGIYVLAGTNGAGKSSIGGAMPSRTDAAWFNPDEAARRIREHDPSLSQEQANSAAWHQGARLLHRAIDERLSFAFETTLGGRTISTLLAQALANGIEVRMWFVGLTSPELHIARVQRRVAGGGHDIPEERIRYRYDRSRLNLIHVLPALTQLWVYDNSDDAAPEKGIAPEPLLVLHMSRGTIVDACDLTITPGWAKPIVAAAIRAQRAPRR